ncbi:single stranded DNA-binding protein (ssb) [Variovorax sp. HW608]|uniref:single-stranded DNA-binding protein n=1 Tax=Variovorax sp. HW608 TaxID=1034889 RepID=UPI00081F914D|nr:single-stranded DNA-binding protein [Variovorax sp. HW608]SCK09237.1 single stranded DNA-binding protein (ssb) [Variovorax sp. HW608]
MNRQQLIGRLGRAPDVRETARGLVVTLSIATNEYWRDRESGEMRSHTEWHTCVCFDRLAEVARDHLQKGDEVFVEGKSRSSRWTDKDGVERMEREMRVEEMRMLRRSHVDAIASAVRMLESIEGLAQKMKRGEAECDVGTLASMIARVRGELTRE